VILLKKFLLSFVLFIVISGYSTSSELTLYEFMYRHTVLKGPLLSEFLSRLYITAEEDHFYLSKPQIDECNRITLEGRRERLFK
jgi:hypothetical protein